MTEVTLEQLIQCLVEESPTPDGMSAGDQLLVARKFGEAFDAYGSEARTPDLNAKRGFCAAMQRDYQTAETLLTTENVGTHSVALSTLALVMAGEYGERIRGFKDTMQVQEEMKAREAVVNDLMKRALSCPVPSLMAYSTAFRIQPRGRGLAEIAARARNDYPRWSWAHGTYARELRELEGVSASVLDDMLGVLGSATHESLFNEGYVYALSLQRFDDAERVIQRLEEVIGEDGPPKASMALELSFMRATVVLCKARASNASALNGLTTLFEPFKAVLEMSENVVYRITASRFMLQAAIDAGDERSVAETARELVDALWAGSGIEGIDLNCWCSTLWSRRLDEVFQVSWEFGTDFEEVIQWVDRLLDGEAKRRWKLFVAAHGVNRSDEPSDHVAVLRGEGGEWGPAWLGLAVYQAQVLHDPVDLAGGGATLAALCERAAMAVRPSNMMEIGHIRGMDCNPSESEGMLEIFRGALEWLKASPKRTGRGLLEAWGSCLANREGADLLAEIAALSISRGEVEVGGSYLATARKHLPQTLESVLAAYPDPAVTRVKAGDLTLLEAAALIALLRASEPDHVRWTIRPLSESSVPFEPTNKFIGAMFDLMAKGVIGVDRSTREGRIQLKDGKLLAYLKDIVWRISANTLALQREIREMKPEAWPESWTNHVQALAIDLGAEELIVYLEFLFEEVRLPVPDREDLRGIFRRQLERLSISQCYYLVHKTRKSVLEYQAKYGAGVRQLESRTIKLLRDNGDRAAADGWSTGYNRVSDLPASMLFEALHDVITGWGDGAFRKPLTQLRIE